MSNKAYLAWTTKVYPHPNADKLELAEVLGYQVIVGKGEVTEDTFGILFLPDSVLTDKAIEIFGEQPYLSKNRVKALTLRGEKSEALFLPADNTSIGLWYAGLKCQEPVVEMPEGELWTSYKLPQKEVDKRNKERKMVARRELPNFPMHMNTEQMRVHRRDIEDAIANPDCQVSVSLKYHGTSQRIGLIVTPDELPWWKRLVNVFTAKYPTESLKLVNGTRRVILTEAVDKDYHTLAFREVVAERLRPYIMANEVWYYEVVGYEPSGRPIMPHPEGRAYHYGLAVGEFGIRVYRITINGIDLTPSEIQSVYDARRIEGECGFTLPYVRFSDVTDIKQIDSYFDQLSNPKNRLNEDFTQEGLCVRIDTKGSDRPKIYKHKTHSFLVEEGRA